MTNLLKEIPDCVMSNGERLEIQNVINFTGAKIGRFAALLISLLACGPNQDLSKASTDGRRIHLPVA